MKKVYLAFLVVIVSILHSEAQESRKEINKQFMQITTVESVVAGGLGRSKMVITNPDGSQKETDLENLFSLAGINFRNIKENEDKILRTIRNYTDLGWSIEKVTSFTLSPGESGQGIFMTRYLLAKETEQ
ncbi:MAG: hypothetical protein GC171_04660 [Terrimonas sp.]|nr:hypothetical protein [Terrimonas sp.]